MRLKISIMGRKTFSTIIFSVLGYYVFIFHDPRKLKKRLIAECLFWSQINLGCQNLELLIIFHFIQMFSHPHNKDINKQTGGFKFQNY